MMDDYTLSIRQCRRLYVEGNMLGDQTPTITNWKAVPADAFPGITLEVPEGSSDGLMCVTRIYNPPFTDLPTTLDLPELTWFDLEDHRGTEDPTARPLYGKKLPTTWNTPKLTYINTAFASLTGTIPQGLAESPVLNQIYIDGCDYYGALPHDWASTTLEVFIANQGNEKLGYMVPAQLDVILNQYDGGGNLINQCNDRTQFKLMNGGNNFIGFEEGWGQERYEKYDNDAEVGNLTVWSDHRLLQDDWAWYFSDIASVPKEMKVWNQADADAYTASCEQ